MNLLQQELRDVLINAMGPGRLAGALAMVWHQGKVVACEAAGHRDIAQGIAMSRDAIFQIASMTKPIVSVATLQLVDEGKISLDSPASTWIQELADLRVLDDPAGPLDRTQPASSAITIDDLLTHRAGFGYAFTESGPVAKALEVALGHVLYTKLSPDEWIRALASVPLLYQPGDRFNYGHSTEVLGCLIARIDGCSLGKSLERRIFKPLGMKDTAFHVSAGNRPRLAHMYRRGPTGLEDVTNAPDASPRFQAGGGGLYSTADDYLAFSLMMLGGGALDGVHVLSAELCRRMTTNQLSEPQRALGGLNHGDFFANSGFGLGVQVVLTPAAPVHTSAGTFSWGGIFGTGWTVDPSNELVCLLFVQDHADISAGPDRHDSTQPTPAGELRETIEQTVWKILTGKDSGSSKWKPVAQPSRRRT